MRILKKIRRTFKARLFATVAALGLFANPFNAHASEITDKDGNNLIDNSAVHNLYAQELNNSLGVSRYDKFNLSENEIANMFFNVKGGSVFADSLINFVNNRIDINGTVNAIRNGAIDGNLLFLSPEGIAVGSTGIINAGSFTAYSLDEDKFKDLRDMSADKLFTQYATNIANGFSDQGSKSVDIKGVINARNAINLYGKNISVAGTLNQNTNIDFKDYVNAGSTINNINNLVVTADGADIIIDSGTDGINIKAIDAHKADDSTFNLLGSKEISQWFGNKSTTVEAKIDVGGNINSSKNVNVSASADTYFREGTVFNLLRTTGIQSKLLGATGLELDASYVDKTTNANITLGNINAGGKVTVDAKSNIYVMLNSATPAKKTAQGISNFIPTAAFNYLSSDSAATIDMKGAVNAGGDIALNAENTSELRSIAKSQTDVSTSAEDTTESVLYTAIGLLAVDNNSKINIADTVTTTGTFTANALNDSFVSNDVNAAAPDDTVLTTALGIADVDNAATVNLNANVAANAIDVDAKNTVSDIQSVKNSLGKDQYNNMFVESGNPGALDKLFGKLGNKMPAWDSKGMEGAFGDLVNGKYFKAGASVGVYTENNDANVNVADNVNLNAGSNALAVDALNEITTLNVKTTNIYNNKATGHETNKIGVSGAVNVGDFDNNANVIVGKGAQLSGSDVAVNSDFNFDYNVFEHQIDVIVSRWEKFVDDMKNVVGSFEDNEVTNELDELKNASNSTERALKMADIHSMLNEKYSDESPYMSALKSSASVYTDAKKLANAVIDSFDPATYTHFYARSEIQNTQKQDNSSTADIGATINIAAMNNDARTLIGSNAAINAGNNADIASNAATNTVMLTGMGGAYLTTNQSSNNAIGASVNVSNIDSNSVAVIGKNAKLTANNDLTVKADQMLDSVDIIYGAGIAGDSGFNGMVNVISGNSNAIASVDDEITINGKNVNINADNNSNLTAVTGGLSITKAQTKHEQGGTQAAIGAAVNVTDFDVNSIAIVSDNAKDAEHSTAVLTEAEIQELTDLVDSEDELDDIDREAALKEVLDKARRDKLKNDQELTASYNSALAIEVLNESLTDDQLALLGAKTDGAKGSITATAFNITSTTEGDINSVALEGASLTNKTGAFDTFNKWSSTGANFTNSLHSAVDWPQKKLTKKITKGLSTGFSKIKNLIKGNKGDVNKSAKQASNNAAGNQNAGADQQDAGDLNLGDGAQQALSDLQITGAGSVAVNDSNGNTASVLDNVNVNAGAVKVSGDDDLYKGAYAGAAAVNWFSNTYSAGGSSYAIGGAAGVNESERSVNAIINNSTLAQGSNNLDVTALKDGVDVGVGLGVAVTKSGGDTKNAAFGVSVNLTENDVHALVVNSNTDGFNSANLKAEDADVQVAGGVSTSVVVSDDNSSVGNLGASVAIGDIDNDIRAGIYGGTHNLTNDLTIDAVKGTTQVNAGVAVAVTSDSGNASDYTFSGAVVYGGLTNNNAVAVENANVTANSINLLSDETVNANEHRAELTAMGIDLDGSSYGGEMYDKLLGTGGSGAVIVGAAVGVSATAAEGGDGGTADVSVAVNDVDNKTATTIKNATLNATAVNADALDKTTVVNVSAGGTGSSSSQQNSTSFGGAGSVGWDDVDMDNTLSIESSTINSKAVTGSTANDARLVNVAGEVAVAGGTVAGLAIAVNTLDNESAIAVKDTAINNDTGAISFNADNTGAIDAAAVALNISTKSGAYNGNIAVNVGGNHTKAELDNLTATNVKNLTVNTADTVDKNTVAGAIDLSLGSDNSPSGNIGASIAYTAVGESDDKEQLRAAIENSTITTVDSGAININSKDTSTSNTVAAGVGVSTGQSLIGAQGGAALSFIEKDVDAVANKNTINGNADLNILADSANDITSVGAVVSGSSQSSINAAVALGVNKINQDTNATFTGDPTANTIANTIDNGTVKALSNSRIASGSGSGELNLSSDAVLAAAGSGSYNYIGSNTTATVDNVSLNATKNFGVIAQSDDALSNYAGAIEGSAGVVGLGVGLSINSIDGDTNAKVSNSAINAVGSNDETIAVNHKVSDDAIIDAAVTKDAWTATRLQKARSTENLSGFIVDASSTHALSSDLASVSVNLGQVAVAGALNFNFIDGNTNAAVNSTDINANSDSPSDIYIYAADYSNKGAFTGGASGAKNFAAGLSSGWSTVERETNATFNSGTANANDFALKSIGRQGVSDWVLSAAGAVDSSFAAETGDNFSRNKNASTTKAELKDATVNYNGNANVNSDHASNVIALNTAGGLAVGGNGIAGALNVGVALSTDESTVQTTLDNAKLLSSNTTSTANIGADNKSLINDDLYSIGIAASMYSAGLAGDVAVNNLESKVQTALNNSEVTANTINVKTNDNIDISTSGGAGALGTLFGAGASVAVNTANNAVGTDITEGTKLTASDTLTVETTETRSLDGTTAGVGVSGIAGIAVNVTTASVNSSINDLEDSTTKDLVGEHLNTVNKDDSVKLEDYFYGVSSTDKAKLTNAKDAIKADIGNPTTGVQTNISNATLTATNAVKISGIEQNDADFDNGTGVVGGGSASVADTVLNIKHDTKAAIINSTVSGKTIDINATQTNVKDGINSLVVEAGAGAANVGVGYNSVNTGGTTEISLAGSNITATDGNINATASDDTKLYAQNVSAGLTAIGVPLTFGKTVNTSTVAISTDGDASLNDAQLKGKALNLRAERTPNLESEVYQVGVGGTEIAVTHSTASDNGSASVLLKRSGGTYEADEINVSAVNQPSAKSDTPAVTVSIVGFTNTDSTAELKGSTNIVIDGGNTLKAPTVNLTATTGVEGTVDANAELLSVNAGAAQIVTAPNTALASTEIATNIDVGDQTYGEATALNINATNNLNRYAYAVGDAFGALASGRDKAETSSADAINVAVGSNGSNTVASLTINAINNSVSNHKGAGASGGVADIASMSFAENNSSNSTLAQVGGSWNITNDLTINAKTVDTINQTARQGHGSVIGGNGIYADNTIKGTTSTKIADKANIKASNVAITSTNELKTGGFIDEDGEEDTYTLNDYYGGAVTIDGLSSELTVDKKADININGAVTTTGTQNYSSATTGTLNNKVHATGGGGINVNVAKSTNTIGYKNEIGIGGALESTGDIYISADDRLAINTAAQTSTGGLEGTLVAKTTNDITRINQIDMKSKVHTAGNLTATAGGNKDDFFGTDRSLTINTTAESNNYTALPFGTSTTADYKLDDTNAINVSGNVSTDGDVEMTADGGAIDLDAQQISWLWAGGGSNERTLETSFTTNDFGGTRNNNVNVNGLLRAGANVQDIEIELSGQAVPSGANIAGTDNSGTINVTKSEDVEVTTGDMDYANVLGTRLLELNELIASYDIGTGSTAALSGYITERQRLLEKMNELGLIETGTLDGQTIKTPITSGYTIKYAEIGDIERKGGNITLQTATVKGKGTITAAPSPNVTINNTSNAYLKLNDISLNSSGGEVFLNGRSINTGDASVSAGLTVNGSTAKGGSIIVNNNPNTAQVSVTSTDGSGSATYVPHTAVDVVGVLDAERGDVTIVNNGGDIDVSTTGSVLGANVQLTASNSINQGYTAGIVNIGGSPEEIDVVKTEADSLKAQASSQSKASASTVKKTGKWVEGGTTGGRIAGENIYLAADYINVNGIIQSGYDSYTANTDKLASAVKDINDANAILMDESRKVTSNGRELYYLYSYNYRGTSKRYMYYRPWQNDFFGTTGVPIPSVSDLTQAEAQAALNKKNTAQTLLQTGDVGGSVYNAEKGYYDYQLPIGYDAATGHFKVGDINTGGGSIYLSGNIISTGEGKIFAANGQSKINITNDSDIPIDLGVINNNNRVGKITIADTARDVWTEYTAGQTRVINRYSEALERYKGDVESRAKTTKNSLSDGSTLYYMPASMSYNWTEGSTTQTVQNYHRTTNTLFWGGLDTKTEEDMAKYESSNPATPQTLSDAGLPSGTFVSTGANESGMQLTSQVVLTSNPTRTNYRSWKESGNWWALWSNPTYHYAWTTKTGSLQAQTFTLPANNPITVGFIGSTGETALTSIGDIYIKGNVDMGLAGAQLMVQSTGGGIYQSNGTNITAGIAAFGAANDISGIDILGLSKNKSDVLLMAQSDNGNINAKVQANSARYGQESAGNVQLRGFTSKGNASLTADGNINGNSVLTANAANIVSNNGKIELKNFDVKALTAKAAGNIELTAENINVKELDSGGTIKLKGNVKLIETETLDSSEETLTEKIHGWIDAGQIAPTEDYEGARLTQLKADAASYKSTVENEYSQYQDIDVEKYNEQTAAIEAEYQQYEAVDRDAYNELVSTTATDYARYAEVRSNIEGIYREYAEYRDLNSSWYSRMFSTDYVRLQAKFGGYSTVEQYIKAATNYGDLLKYRGYSSAEQYVMAIGGTDARLISKYDGYDSAQAYIEGLTETKLLTKYGDYADAEAYLTADSTYQGLLTAIDEAYDASKYPATLEQMINLETSVKSSIKGRAVYHNGTKIQDASTLQ